MMKHSRRLHCCMRSKQQRHSPIRRLSKNTKHRKCKKTRKTHVRLSYSKMSRKNKGGMQFMHTRDGLNELIEHTSYEAMKSMRWAASRIFGSDIKHQFSIQICKNAFLPDRTNTGIDKLTSDIVIVNQLNNGITSRLKRTDANLYSKDLYVRMNLGTVDVDKNDGIKKCVLEQNMLYLRVKTKNDVNMEVTVPEGYIPGEKLFAESPMGFKVAVKVPHGVIPGQQTTVKVPDNQFEVAIDYYATVNDFKMQVRRFTSTGLVAKLLVFVNSNLLADGEKLIGEELERCNFNIASKGMINGNNILLFNAEFGLNDAVKVTIGDKSVRAIVVDNRCASKAVYKVKLWQPELKEQQDVDKLQQWNEWKRCFEPLKKTYYLQEPWTTFLNRPIERSYYEEEIELSDECQFVLEEMCMNNDDQIILFEFIDAMINGFFVQEKFMKHYDEYDGDYGDYQDDKQNDVLSLSSEDNEAAEATTQEQTGKGSSGHQYEVKIKAHTKRLGIVFEENQAGQQRGVKVKEVKNRSIFEGVEAGDRLLEVSGKDVTRMTMQEVMLTIVQKSRDTDEVNEPRVFTFCRGCEEEDLQMENDGQEEEDWGEEDWGEEDWGEEDWDEEEWNELEDDDKCEDEDRRDEWDEGEWKGKEDWQVELDLDNEQQFDQASTFDEQNTPTPIIDTDMKFALESLILKSKTVLNQAKDNVNSANKAAVEEILYRLKLKNTAIELHNRPQEMHKKKIYIEEINRNSSVTVKFSSSPSDADPKDSLGWGFKKPQPGANNDFFFPGGEDEFYKHLNTYINIKSSKKQSRPSRGEAANTDVVFQLNRGLVRDTCKYHKEWFNDHTQLTTSVSLFRAEIQPWHHSEEYLKMQISNMFSGEKNTVKLKDTPCKILLDDVGQQSPFCLPKNREKIVPFCDLYCGQVVEINIHLEEGKTLPSYLPGDPVKVPIVISDKIHAFLCSKKNGKCEVIDICPKKSNNWNKRTRYLEDWQCKNITFHKGVVDSDIGSEVTGVRWKVKINDYPDCGSIEFDRQQIKFDDREASIYKKTGTVAGVITNSIHSDGASNLGIGSLVEVRATNDKYYSGTIIGNSKISNITQTGKFDILYENGKKETLVSQDRIHLKSYTKYIIDYKPAKADTYSFYFHSLLLTKSQFIAPAPIKCGASKPWSKKPTLLIVPYSDILAVNYSPQKILSISEIKIPDYPRTEFSLNTKAINDDITEGDTEIDKIFQTFFTKYNPQLLPTYGKERAKIFLQEENTYAQTKHIAENFFARDRDNLQKIKSLKNKVDIVKLLYESDYSYYRQPIDRELNNLYYSLENKQIIELLRRVYLEPNKQYTKEEKDTHQSIWDEITNRDSSTIVTKDNVLTYYSDDIDSREMNKIFIRVYEAFGVDQHIRDKQSLNLEQFRMVDDEVKMYRLNKILSEIPKQYSLQGQGQIYAQYISFREWFKTRDVNKIFNDHKVDEKCIKTIKQIIHNFVGPTSDVNAGYELICHIIHHTYGRWCYDTDQAQETAIEAADEYAERNTAKANTNDNFGKMIIYESCRMLEESELSDSKTKDDDGKCEVSNVGKYYVGQHVNGIGGGMVSGTIVDIIPKTPGAKNGSGMLQIDVNYDFAMMNVIHCPTPEHTFLNSYTEIPQIQQLTIHEQQEAESIRERNQQTLKKFQNTLNQQYHDVFTSFLNVKNKNHQENLTIMVSKLKLIRHILEKCDAIQLIDDKLKNGAPVEVNRNPGKITKDNNDGTYEVTYKGDEEKPSSAVTTSKFTKWQRGTKRTPARIARSTCAQVHKDQITAVDRRNRMINIINRIYENKLHDKPMEPVQKTSDLKKIKRVFETLHTSVKHKGLSLYNKFLIYSKGVFAAAPNVLRMIPLGYEDFYKYRIESYLQSMTIEAIETAYQNMNVEEKYKLNHKTIQLFLPYGGRDFNDKFSRQCQNPRLSGNFTVFEKSGYLSPSKTQIGEHIELKDNNLFVYTNEKHPREIKNIPISEISNVKINEEEEIEIQMNYRLSTTTYYLCSRWTTRTEKKLDNNKWYEEIYLRMNGEQNYNWKKEELQGEGYFSGIVFTHTPSSVESLRDTRTFKDYQVSKIFNPFTNELEKPVPPLSVSNILRKLASEEFLELTDDGFYKAIEDPNDKFYDNSIGNSLDLHEEISLDDPVGKRVYDRDDLQKQSTQSFSSHESTDRESLRESSYKANSGSNNYNNGRDGLPHHSRKRNSSLRNSYHRQSSRASSTSRDRRESSSSAAPTAPVAPAAPAAPAPAAPVPSKDDEEGSLSSDDEEFEEYY